MRIYWVFLLLIMAFALGSCYPSPAGTENSQNLPSLLTQELPTMMPPATPSPESPNQILPGSTAQGENTPMAPALPTPYDPGLQSLIEKAKEDLAKRLSIAAAEISVVEAIQVTWPDASLGCPKMGVMYLQVVTPGFQITLEISGKKFIYHTDDKERIVFCPGLRPGEGIPPSPYPDQ